MTEITPAPESDTKPPITAIDFAPDGQALVAVSQSGLHVFDWPQLKLIRTINVSSPNLHSVAFSPDGSQVAAGGGSPSEDGVVAVWAWPTAELLATLEGHRDSVRSLAWLDDSRLISASVDRSIKLWNVRSGDDVSALEGHSRSVDAACVLPGGKVLVSAGADQSVRVWDLQSSTLRHSLNQHTGNVQTLALRPDGGELPLVASGGDDRTIRFWQPTIGRMVRYSRLDSEPLSIAWLKDSQHIAAACSDGHLRIVDADKLTVVLEMPAIDGWAYAIKVHPSDGSIVVAGSNGQIRRIDAPALPGT